MEVEFGEYGWRGPSRSEDLIRKETGFETHIIEWLLGFKRVPAAWDHTVPGNFRQVGDQILILLQDIMLLVLEFRQFGYSKEVRCLASSIDEVFAYAVG